MSNEERSLRPGDVRTVTVGAMVHGGHAIAHVDGRTVFVRYACPGEEVVIRITSASRKLVRADAIEIVQASPERVEPPCGLAHPGGCGGCDWQFASLDAQRRWKSEVVRESFERFAGLPDVSVVTEPIRAEEDGLRWRQRAHVTLLPGHSTPNALPAFKKVRSSEAIPFVTCPVLTPGVDSAAHSCPASSTDVWIQEGSDGIVAASAGTGERGTKVRHTVLHRTWRIEPGSFWQAHVGMAEALVTAVLESVGRIDGQTWWDLYAGSGLFSAFLAEGVGESGTVHAVEESARSVREGRRALHDLPQVRLHNMSVAGWLGANQDPVDGVVLDPPRSGAGEVVVDLMARASPGVIVYVACDPVALARDTALLGARGYALTGLRALDGFPMTHHVECVATFVASEIS